MPINPNRCFLTALLMAALAISGCVSPRSRKKSDDDAKKKAGSEETAGLNVPGVDVTEASLRGGEFSAVPELETIYFDYDSSALDENALGVLKRNAAYLREHKGLEIRVAGFCDDRGTVEYNLALGQKRAKEVREYYIRLGVPGKSVATISYGEEQPVCAEPSEACWSKNRRGETRVRGFQAAAAEPAGP